MVYRAIDDCHTKTKGNAKPCKGRPPRRPRIALLGCWACASTGVLDIFFEVLPGCGTGLRDLKPVHVVLAPPAPASSISGHNLHDLRAWREPLGPLLGFAAHNAAHGETVIMVVVSMQTMAS